MSSLSDCLLGGRQSDLGPHRPRQPRAWLDHRRPDSLGQTTQHDQVRRLQPGFQQAPDEDTGMLDPTASPQRPAAAHHLAFQDRVEQSGQHATSQIRHGSPGIVHLRQAGRDGLAFLCRP